MPSFQLSAVTCRLLPSSMHSQANSFYRQHGSAMKARGVHQVWAALTPRPGSSDSADVSGIADESIVACACLQPIVGGDGHWLTSLFVAPGLRHRGLAGHLLRHLRRAGYDSIWLFCRPELAQLYQSHGYQIANRLPESLACKLKRYQRDKQLVVLVSPSPQR